MRKLLLAFLAVSAIAVTGILTMAVNVVLGEIYATVFAVLILVPVCVGVFVAYAMLEPDDA